MHLRVSMIYYSLCLKLPVKKREQLMTERKNYKKTLAACYLGFITQAIAANFAPLLFLTFKDAYGIGL